MSAAVIPMEEIQAYKSYTFPDIFVRLEGTDGTFYGTSWMNMTPSRNGRIYPCSEVIRSFSKALHPGRPLPLLITSKYGDDVSGMVDYSDVFAMVDHFEYHNQMMRIRGHLFTNDLAKNLRPIFDRACLVPSGFGYIDKNIVTNYELKYLTILQENQE